MSLQMKKQEKDGLALAYLRGQRIGPVCLNIKIHEIHKRYEIHIGKAVNEPTGNCYSIDIMYIQ